VNQLDLGEPLAKAVLKVGKKGVVILPKKLREALNAKEGDELIAEASKGMLTLKPLKPKIVDVNPEQVEKILSEGDSLYREKVEKLVKKVFNRH